MTKRAMISQPMAGKTKEEIKEARAKAVEYLESKGYEIVDSYIPPINPCEALLYSSKIKHESVWYLGTSIQRMSFCDLVFFCKGWEQARGCRIEHEAAEKYGLDTMYEE